MVRDRIVSGVTSQEVREKLLTEDDDLSVAKTIDITMLYKVTKEQLASMAASAGNNVDAIRLGREKQHSHHGLRSIPVPDKHPCRNCGGKHGKRECPAFGKTCSYCTRKLNHYARVCLKKQEDHAKQVSYIEGDEQLVIDTISQPANSTEQPNRAYASTDLETVDKIQFKIDTGAQVNVIPTSVYKQLKKQPHLQKTSQRLFGSTGKPTELAGCINLRCTYKHKSYRGTFFIANTANHSQPFLGLQASVDLSSSSLYFQ